MNPGELRDPIKIYRVTRGSDGRGGSPKLSENLVFSTLAKVTPMKPLTSFENDKLTVAQFFSVKVRYARDRNLTPDMKVLWNEQSYLIKNIMPEDTRKRFIHFLIAKS